MMWFLLNEFPGNFWLGHILFYCMMISNVEPEQRPDVIKNEISRIELFSIHLDQFFDDPNYILVFFNYRKGIHGSSYYEELKNIRKFIKLKLFARRCKTYFKTRAAKKIQRAYRCHLLKPRHSFLSRVIIPKIESELKFLGIYTYFNVNGS